jgi:4'-phosphopantetheinyl transferase
MAIPLIRSADASAALVGNAVHVWCIPVAEQADDDAALTDAVNAWLTPVEQARGQRFVQPEDRRRFQLGRAATRRLLAGYLGLSPTAIGLDIDPSGKPRLDEHTRALGGTVHFNISHSGGWIVATFARGFEVGIDVERVSAQALDPGLIDHVLSGREIQSLRALPPQRQTAAFFKGWTSKEAFAKGVGVGLAVRLKSVEVSIDPDAPARLLHAPPPHSSDPWQLHTIEGLEGYAATLAVAARSARIGQIVVGNWRDILGDDQ